MDINTCLATTDSLRPLALYSHLIPALATAVLGVFAYLRAEDRRKALFFFAFSALFALWLTLDVVVWTSDSYHLVAAAWSPLDFIEIGFFLLLFGFVCLDLIPARWHRYLTPALLIAAALPFFITLTGQAVIEMYQPWCEMTGSRVLANYKVFLEALILIATLCIGIFHTIQAVENAERIRTLIVTFAVFLFMGIFSGTEYYATTTGIYEINLYGLFSLPIFILLLTIAITSYGTFKLGDSTVKALFYVFLALAGTQFFAVESLFDFTLTCISFGVVLTLGILLFRSTEREIGFRHELELANRQQESLLHFISHEIKGYLAKSQAGFAAIADGSMGPVTPEVKQLSTSALAEVRKGVATVMDILDASNLKKGTVAYNKVRFDMGSATHEIVDDLRSTAEERGLHLSLTIKSGPHFIEGDEDKIRRHVIRNVIDNSIKYTQHGEVHATLDNDGAYVRLTVADTGVGITPEDMGHLFTEGGHGKDSIKVNVHSTGYGLYIAKEITEGQGGKIWAESPGAGKGSRFIVEFPLIR